MIPEVVCIYIKYTYINIHTDLHTRLATMRHVRLGGFRKLTP